MIRTVTALLAGLVLLGLAVPTGAQVPVDPTDPESIEDRASRNRSATFYLYTPGPVHEATANATLTGETPQNASASATLHLDPSTGNATLDEQARALTEDTPAHRIWDASVSFETSAEAGLTAP